jgi:hypothetical protein
VDQKLGRARTRIVMTQGGWAYVSQRTSFPAFGGGAAADLFHIFL